MIYDPVDQNICMNELGVIFYLRTSPDGTDNGWVELNEMKRNGEFRRPEW
jgi:hypothetical protein